MHRFRLSHQTLAAWAVVLCMPSVFAIPRVIEPLPRISDTVAPEQKAAATAAYNRGIKALSAGDLGAAEASFREVLSSFPRQSAAMLGLAEVAFKRKQLDVAGDWIGKALEADPRDANAHASSGRYWVLKGQSAKAQGAFRRAAELDPTAFRPRMDLADLLLSSGHHKDARTYYQEAVTLQPSHAGARYGLGMTLLQLGELPSAKAELERCTELEPRNPLGWLGMTRVLAAQGAHEQALSAVDKALALQPKLVDALVAKADLLVVTGRSTQAVALLEQAVTQEPKKPSLHMQLAMLHHSSSAVEKAEAAYRKVIELAPGNPVAYNNLADLLGTRSDRQQEALRLAQRAVDLAPKEGGFLDTKGWIQRSAGDLRGAQKTLESALALSPDHGIILYHLAVVNADLGFRQQSRALLQRALSAKKPMPNPEPARKLLDSFGP